MTRWVRFAAVAYASIGAIAWIFAELWGKGSPLTIANAWLPLSPDARLVYSGLFGMAFGAAVIVVTRALVSHFAWARHLHSELRPVASSMSVSVIWLLAALSAFGEEICFRGLLQPFLGVVLQAAVFGAVHQMPGKSRWVWVAWASIMGLALGAMFQLTGSLLGPLIAHALINGFNLQYLKDHDPEPPRRRSLGGLLGERS
jgi:membrane protease YdiL (CAAX protease family)